MSTGPSISVVIRQTIYAPQFIEIHCYQPTTSYPGPPTTAPNPPVVPAAPIAPAATNPQIVGAPAVSTDNEGKNEDEDDATPSTLLKRAAAMFWRAVQAVGGLLRLRAVRPGH